MNRHLALAVVALVLAVRPGMAEDAPKLTCTAFKQGLDDAVHAQGDKVATPKDWHVAHSDISINRLLYGFSGIVGVDGNLSCFFSDEFRQFSFKLNIVANTDEQVALILTRSVALASASVCAAGLKNGDQCWVTAQDMITKAIHTMKLASDRGEPFPRGYEEVDLEEIAGARLTTLPGEMLFEVVSYR